MSPEKIGRYEIAGELGRGAMGLVYKALDPNIGRTVALKTMRLDVCGVEEEDMLRRFKHEARLAGVMNHANIVTIYDAGEDQSVFYIAMEYVAGETLQTVLHEERVLPVKRIIEISRQIGAGLDYAHAHGVIHRDIKPGNIMLGPDGTAKIMDFGIAKSNTSMTSAGQVLGTPTYMSPEQVKGRPLDGRTDLFSWGVVLYEMVTGEKPFTGENLTTIIYKIIHEDPIPPRDLDASVHPGLSHIVTKSLAKNPDERYQTGTELIDDLENYKSIGGDLEGTRVIAAVTSPTVTMPAAAAPAPSSLTPAAATTAHSGAAAAPALAVESAKMPAMQSTVDAPAKQVAQSAPATKRDTNKILAVSAAAVLTLAASYAIIKQRPSSPGASTPSPTPAVQQPIAPVQTAAAGTAQKKSGTKAAEQEKIAADKVIKKSAPTVAAVKPPVKPTAPAEAKFGTASINSQPSGAKVTIGGAVSPQWVTPFTVAKLDPGSYDVIFTKPGYVSQTVNMKVTAGHAAAASASLVTSGATVNVTSNPGDANIWLDGKVTGQVTPAQLKMDAGDHHVMVRKPGFHEEDTALSLKDGQIVNYSATLKAHPGGESPFAKFGRLFGGKSIPEGKGMVAIKTRPAGAHVIHNGQTSAMATPARVPMEPGVYDITLQLDGYAPAQRHFTIEKGKLTDVTVDLVPVKK